MRAPARTDSLRPFKYSVLEFAELIDSSSMDGSHWNLILRCLRLNWNHFDAFVILHGTDTMAYTASALSFMMSDVDKTVILTGSQLSMYAPHTDAHDNLLDSLTVASAYIVPEVSVVFHHHLYRATRVTKVSAFSVAGFTTPNAKPLATFERHAGRPWTFLHHSKRINSAWELRKVVPEGTPASAFNEGWKMETNRVAVLKVYPGISADLISGIVQIPNLGGLVLETFGAGNIPLGNGSKGLLDILAAAVQNGIVVVSVTQCKSMLIPRKKLSLIAR
jgi:60kDa lysophospholipase